jgi:hypothetical protein
MELVHVFIFIFSAISVCEAQYSFPESVRGVDGSLKDYYCLISRP